MIQIAYDVIMIHRFVKNVNRPFYLKVKGVFVEREDISTIQREDALIVILHVSIVMVHYKIIVFFVVGV